MSRAYREEVSERFARLRLRHGLSPLSGRRLPRKSEEQPALAL